MNVWKCTLLLCLTLGALQDGLVAPSMTHAQDAPAAIKELRTWKTKDGGFSTEAALLEKKGDIVVLERKDGKVINVPLAKLSLDDRAYVAEFLKQPAPQAVAPEAAGAPAAEFNVDDIIKRWNQPRELFQLTPHAVISLERKPDVLEYSANGEFLYAVFFKEAKHLIYGTADGKLLHTIEYGTVPLRAAAITPDGKHVVATLGDKGTGVYDVAAKKEVFVHPDIKNVNVLQTTTGKNTYILGSEPSGEYYRYRLLDKFGVAFPRPPGAPEKFDPDSRTELISGADGNFVMVHWPFDPKTYFVFQFEDDGRMKEYVLMKIAEDKLSPTAIGKRVIHYLAGTETHCSSMLEMKSSRFISQDFTGTAPPQLFMSPDDSHGLVYEPDRRRLTIKHLASGYTTAVQVRLGTKTDFIRLHWNAAQVAACSTTGNVVLLKMRGHRHRNEMILADVLACLESKQDDRLEKLAAAIEMDQTFFSEGVPRDTKYNILEGCLRNEGKLRYPNDGINPAWRAWQERNPNSRLTRFVRLSKLVDEAWKARGEGFASTVTAEGWRGFHEKMSEAEPIIESFAQEPTIPPAAYPLIFLVAKGQQWDEAKTHVFLERMLKECPENSGGHVEYAYSLQPRWGGKIDGPRIYAERIRKEFPGAVGEGVYTAISLALYFCNSYRVFEELGFDKELAQAGVKQLYRNNLNTPHHRQAELLLAVISRNGPEQRRWHTEVVRHKDAWIRGVMKEKTFDEITEQLEPK